MIKLIFCSIAMFMLMKNMVLEIYIFTVLMLFLIQFLIINIGLMPKISFFECSVNSVSSGLVLLSLWINLVLLAYPNPMFYNKSSMMLLSNIFFLIVLVIYFFYSQKIFFFYMFFELSLIPIFLIIMGWGYQSERVKASLMFMFYTISASLPLLIVLLFLTSYYSMFSFIIIENIYNQVPSFFFYLTIFMFSIAFLVKVPMFLVHLWLPKAHTEAPVMGSMILAAILLKLGTYGIYMLSIYCINFKMWNWIFSISLMGGFIMSLLCLQLTDLKMIIAYSSVSHMSMILVSLSILQIWGSWSAFFLMLAHGFTSSGLFMGVNMIYDRSHSRSILFNKGLIYQGSNFIIFWFFLIICNMAAPPTLNFFSEIFAIISMVNSFKFNMIPMFFMIMCTSGYSLIIFSSISHGKNKMNSFFQKINSGEFLSLSMHLIWSLLLIFSMYNYI